jgi:hypothetical protein
MFHVFFLLHIISIVVHGVEEDEAVARIVSLSPPPWFKGVAT